MKKPLVLSQALTPKPYRFKVAGTLGEPAPTEPLLFLFAQLYQLRALFYVQAYSFMFKLEDLFKILKPQVLHINKSRTLWAYNSSIMGPETLF